MLNLPVINILGSEEIGIENYRNIIEYTSEQVRILTSCGVLKINGNGMVLKSITAENIIIAGKIGHVGYI